MTRRRGLAAPVAVALALGVAAGAGAAEESPPCSETALDAELEWGVPCEFADGASRFHQGRYEEGSYDSAIPWLERALERRPEPDAGDRVLLYGRLARYRYLPYFYLARSYQEARRARDCVAALDYYRRSCAAGQIQTRSKLLRRLEEKSRECQAEAGGEPFVCAGPVAGSSP